MKFDIYIDLLKKAGFKNPSDFELLPLAKEASSRLYFRLIQKNLGISNFKKKTSEVQSCILCTNLPKPYQDQDSFVLMTGFLRSQNIRVPQILAIDHNLGAMLLSDGGEIELCKQIEIEKNNAKNLKYLCRESINLLFSIQDFEWSAIPSLIRDRIFDYQKLKFEMEYTKKEILNLNRTHKLKLDFPQDWEDFIHSLCKQLAYDKNISHPSLKGVLCHRDYHSRNILLSEKNDFSSYTLIDYQDARMGSPFYDLISFLYDPYIQLPKELIIEELDFYIEKSPLDFSIPFHSKKELYSLIYTQAFQRILKALGTYLHQNIVLKHKVYSKYMSIAIAIIITLLQDQEEYIRGDMNKKTYTDFIRFFHSLSEKVEIIST